MKRGSFLAFQRLDRGVDLVAVHGYLTTCDSVDLGIYRLNDKWFVIDLESGLAIHRGSYRRLYFVKKILPTMVFGFKEFVRYHQTEYGRMVIRFSERMKNRVEETDLSQRVDLV